MIKHSFKNACKYKRSKSESQIEGGTNSFLEVEGENILIWLILDKKNKPNPVWAELDEFWHVVTADTQVNIADVFSCCLN